LLGVSCSEIAGQTVHLRDLLGPITDHLQCRLIQASSWSQRFDLLDQTFIGIMQERDIASELDWAWNTLITTGGRARIEKVSNSLGWSRPHFAKRFRNEFGVSPKTVARIARFEQATAMIRSGEGRLANVAIASAFYDQAHMTREWQRLAGCSPKTWIGEELPFLQDYEFAELEYFV
jgi:AraC-like DNA-binding protein